MTFSDDAKNCGIWNSLDRLKEYRKDAAHDTELVKGLIFYPVTVKELGELDIQIKTLAGV
jgi:hypothetical protein